MHAHKRPQIVYGLFTSPKHFVQAYRSLLDAHVSMDDISLLMSEDTHERDFRILSENWGKEGAAAGGIVGGTLGGFLGGVASLGTAITGLGMVVIGPMLALAATGGLLGGLIGHGIPKDEAERLSREISSGKSMIAVHVRAPIDVEKACAIFAAEKGETLESLSA
jgi:hypothetical protein